MESFYFHFEKITSNLLPRSKDILYERFGVVGGCVKTLEEIGEKYSITRERVRQIIKSSLKEAMLFGKTHFYEVSKTIETTLREKSGIASECDLLKTLAKGDVRETAALRFFLESSPLLVTLIKEDAYIKRSYALKDFSYDEWKKTMKDAVSLFERHNQSIEKNELLKMFSQKYALFNSKKLLFNYFAVSKEVKSNVFGKFGLVSWSDISPKSTREKAYLILKTKHEPLHFREITDYIDIYGLNKITTKKTHPQTVHNELIKDCRFVLVGRGIYALSEWGYAEGAVKDVIVDILRKHNEPMKKEAIIKSVLALRQVKKSTIIINLNTFFAKVGKDGYTLKGE
jgi:DNA-directed RNA polymerase delta subunit